MRNCLKYFNLMLLLGLCLGLGACNHHHMLQQNTEPLASHAPTGPCGRMGQSTADQVPAHEVPLRQNGQLMRQLVAHQIDVLPIGDKVSLLLYTDNYFAAGDDVLRRRHYAGLDLVARLLNAYGNAVISVAVSSDNVDTSARDKVLSLRRAQRIASYLWRQGVSAWRLYPSALNQRQRFASNSNAYASRQNRRIEITFNPQVTANMDCQQVHQVLSDKPRWLTP